MDSIYPPRIQEVIDQLPQGNVVFAFKTQHKPNATIPILWLILHHIGILLCSTHRTRRIYKDIKSNEIDSIAIRKGEVKIIHHDMDTDDFIFEIPDDIDLDKFKAHLTALKYQVL